MAVALTREGTDKTLPAANLKLPQVKVRNLPVLTPKHFQTGPVTGRTQTVYSCGSPGRDAFWKDNYERRQSQLSEGGFHGSPGHRYKEIGSVQLDDKTLILQALGQTHLYHNNNESKEHTASKTEAVNALDIIGTSPNMRAKTALQFPDQLITLHEELERVDVQLDKVRKGSGLFHMLHNDKEEKEKETREINEQKQKEKAVEWLPPSRQELDDSSYSSLQDKGTQHVIEDDKSDDDNLSTTYNKLSTILWILECMKLESPQYMPSLYSYWFKNRPVISEEKGRLIYERSTALLKQYEQITCDETDTQQANKHKEQRQKTRPSSKLERLKNEENKIRRQRKLSPEQIEKLKQIIEEELNRAKKRTKNSIKKLMEEKALSNTMPKTLADVSGIHPPNIDSSNIAANFDSVKETRDMIVHEQLSVMARERQEAIQQRFTSLEITGNMWIDLNNMRQGVEIETTDMARNKLMMNYNWLDELKSEIPVSAVRSRYCQEILIQLSTIQDYMRTVGPKIMSQDKLLTVLGLLREWELEEPIISSSIHFIITRIIYVVPEDYQVWLEYHKQKATTKQQT